MLDEIRHPVLLWEVPTVKRLLVVEVRDGGLSIWLAGDQGASGNIGTPQPAARWCSVAVNDRTPFVGNLVQQSTLNVTVDDFDGGIRGSNHDLRVGQCAPALAHYPRLDGGFAFLGVSSVGSDIHFERSCLNCTLQTFGFAAGMDPRVDEAVTDGNGVTWVSAAIGPTKDTLVALNVAPDSTRPVQHTLFDGGGSKVELSAFGSSVHAAWTSGRTLWLSTLSLDGGTDELRSWAVPSTMRVVDLVENANTVVAVLTSPAGNAVLIRQAGVDSFFQIATPAYRFRPTTALLRSTLRIAGQCLFADGGPGGDQDAGRQGSQHNPVLEFSSPPAGTW